jgi:hypothetical protein
MPKVSVPKIGAPRLVVRGDGCRGEWMSPGAIRVSTMKLVLRA